MTLGDITPRRVLMTTDTVSGVWPCTLDLARGLGELGLTITLASMGALPSAEQRRDAAHLPTLDLRESTYRLEWMEDPWDDVKAAGEWLLALEDEVQPHLVHSNGYTHAQLPFTAPVVVAAHGCVFSWWESVRHQPPPPEWSRYRREVTNGLRAAGMVVTPSYAMMEALRRHYGEFPPGRVVPNGRQALVPEAEEKEPLVLSVGRLSDEAANVLALEPLAETLPWPVYVADDSQPAGIQAPRLHCLGRLLPQELARWYARAAIYALPARYEPFGLSPLEAGLAGCALVLGDIPSLREQWQDAALFVSPDDTAALGRTLRMLMEDGERRGEMALRARARAAHFTPRRMADGYLSVYRDLLRAPEQHRQAA